MAFPCCFDQNFIPGANFQKQSHAALVFSVKVLPVAYFFRYYSIGIIILLVVQNFNIASKAELKFCTTNKIFVYFRLGHTKQQIAVLDNVVRTREKIRTIKFSAAFFKHILAQTGFFQSDTRNPIFF